MNFKIFFLFVLNFLFTSCLEPKREDSSAPIIQKHMSYNRIGYNSFETKIIEYEFSKKNSNYFIKFLQCLPNKRKQEIFIDKNSGQESKIVTFYNDTLSMYFVEKKSFVLNQEEFEVSKYIIIPEGIRGETIILINHKIGILYKKNVNSGSFLKIYSSGEQNYQQLIDIIIDDFEFANKTGLPIPPPPIPPD
ncbi:MAG: hypothetical protein IPK21_04625 [Haliscomenobacter sp.]|nr:hypothetical protein [Haliscomenobacter sp.]